MNLVKRIEEIYPELVNIRRDFHKHPELSNHEHRTQEKIMSYLDTWQIKNKISAKTGVLAEMGSGNSIALRADIDALPVQEVNDVSYKSIHPGVMHACGHDVHTTILLGTAKILSEMNLPKGVKFFFQPAEETTGGALPMIEEGVLENVEEVYGLHVMPYLESGKIEVKHGQLNASSTYMSFDIHGLSGHGAYPEQGVDAIVAASQVINALQTVVSRNVSPLNSVVISIGSFHGGNKANIICDHVQLKGTMRTLNPETKAMMKERVRHLVTQVCSAMNANVEISFEDGYEALINDKESVDRIIRLASKTLGSEKIVHKEHPSLGVEDFSYFSNRVPGAFYHLGCQIPGTDLALHNKDFDVDEECIKTGVLMQVSLVLDYMSRLNK